MNSRTAVAVKRVRGLRRWSGWQPKRRVAEYRAANRAAGREKISLSLLREGIIVQRKRIAVLAPRVVMGVGRETSPLRASPKDIGGALQECVTDVSREKPPVSKVLVKCLSRFIVPRSTPFEKSFPPSRPSTHPSPLRRRARGCWAQVCCFEG